MTADKEADGEIDRETAGRRMDIKKDRQAGWQRGTLKYSQAGMEAGRQTVGLNDKQTGKQTNS